MGDSIQMEMTNVSKFLIFHNGLIRFQMIRLDSRFKMLEHFIECQFWIGCRRDGVGWSFK